MVGSSSTTADQSKILRSSAPGGATHVRPPPYHPSQEGPPLLDHTAGMLELPNNGQQLPLCATFFASPGSDLPLEMLQLAVGQAHGLGDGVQFYALKHQLGARAFRLAGVNWNSQVLTASHGSA